MDCEDLESAYQAKCADLEACKLELKQLKGSYAMLLNNIGQTRAKHEQRRRENERLVRENAELRREVVAVRDAVLAVGGEWQADSGGGVRIVPPDMAEVVERCDELADKLCRCREERDQWRALCGELMDAADEIRRIADTRMPQGGLAVMDKEGEVVG